VVKVVGSHPYAQLSTMPWRHIREWRYSSLHSWWRWAVSFAPQGKSPWYPLDRRLVGPQSWSGCDDEKKKSLLSPFWELNPGHPACNLITTITVWHEILCWTAGWPCLTKGIVFLEHAHSI